MSWSAAHRTMYGAHTYASMHEADFARDLDYRLAAGEIREWRRQDRVLLVDAARHADRIYWVLDFRVADADGDYWVEVKGRETEVFSVKLRLWKALRPDKPLLIVRRDRRGELHEWAVARSSP